MKCKHTERVYGRIIEAYLGSTPQSFGGDVRNDEVPDKQMKQPMNVYLVGVNQALAGKRSNKNNLEHVT